jgi:hypothetical protein
VPSNTPNYATRSPHQPTDQKLKHELRQFERLLVSVGCELDLSHEDDRAQLRHIISSIDQRRHQSRQQAAPKQTGDGSGSPIETVLANTRGDNHTEALRLKRHVRAASSSELDGGDDLGDELDDDDDADDGPVSVNVEGMRSPFSSAALESVSEDDDRRTGRGAPALASSASPPPPVAPTTGDWLYEYLMGQSKPEQTHETGAGAGEPKPAENRRQQQQQQQQEQEQRQQQPPPPQYQCLCPPGT